jgi:hypothetical protein
LTVSEQQAEQTSGETGSLNAGTSDSPSSVAQSEQIMASAPEISVVGSPPIAPDHEAPKADEPKFEAPRIEVIKAEAPGVEAPKVEPRKVEAPTPGKRRFAAVAAVMALTTVAGALGGALATASFGHLVGVAEATSPADSALEASIARIDADILALKADVEHTSKTAISQFTKTADRLDRLEKAQAEPAAKLAKLGEAVDKLRTVPSAAAAAPVAAKEVTGSIAAQATAAAPAAAAPKVEVARLPTVDGWVLSDVGYGGALIENRRGSYEVYAGDNVPGLGRIDAIRKQDGHWVVVTSKGLIVAR